MERRIKVIGIGNSGKDSLLPIYRQWIDESERLVGGERHLSFFPEYQGEKFVVKGSMKEIVSRLETQDKRTVVLASGDPLFYGIGAYLAKRLPVDIYPGVSSVQEAFAKLGESWQNAAFFSVHGRKMTGLVQKIDGLETICLLTDETNSPKEIAKYLLHYGMNEYEAFVAEDLGGPSEKTGWFNLDELAGYDAHPLNLVILKRRGDSPSWPTGIPDHEFRQRKPDKGLITKREVRVLSLSELRLKRDSVVWDIGTCTGSVAIEAAKICREGDVFAIEKNEADIENCKQNMKRFRVDFMLVHGKAPERLDQFSDPDAIFIGGTGGNLSQLIHVCCQRLKKDGRIVLNAATVETLYRALEAFQSEGFNTSVTLAQIARSKKILDMTRFEGMNPVYIITAQHEGVEA